MITCEFFGYTRIRGDTSMYIRRTDERIFELHELISAVEIRNLHHAKSLNVTDCCLHTYRATPFISPGRTTTFNLNGELAGRT